MSDAEAQVVQAEEEATKEVAKDAPAAKENSSPVKSAEKSEKNATEAEEVTNEDDDSKASENGKSEESKENGSSEEKEVDDKEAESTNGDSTDAPTDNVCSIKRKSTGGEVTHDAVKDVVSPKKAKIDEEAPAVKVAENGA